MTKSRLKQSVPFDNFHWALWKDYNRSVCDWDTEYAFVQDAFDAYEKYGFVDSFVPYCDASDELRKYAGQSFNVIRRVSTVLDGWEMCCLPAWLIEFNDGFQVEAYPEEISRRILRQ